MEWQNKENMTTKTRCEWVNSDQIYIDYHDNEWGIPVYDDQMLFEFLCLEGAQAGLSWITVLKKRAHYRKVFDNFDAEKIAKYDQAKIDTLLQDPGIIRNKLKVNGFVKNAKAYLALKKEHGSFTDFIWAYVDGTPIINHPATLNDIPTKTEVSDKMCKDLKKLGFTFVGSTICYAFMQACGLVNDHTEGCFKCS